MILVTIRNWSRDFDLFIFCPFYDRCILDFREGLLD